MRAGADALVRAVHVVAGALARHGRDDCRRISGTLRYLLTDQGLVTQALVVHAQVEELVEVELVLHQEPDITRLELHYGVAQDV